MKENDIRPEAMFEEYLRLAKKDTTTYFENSQRIEGLCPACDAKGAPAFVKSGFSYEECPGCHTLYVNPRPTADAFSKYYTEAPSTKYWATTFYKETAEARREKLWRPKARMIKDILSDLQASSHQIVDVGGGYGIFAEEMRAITGNPPIIVEPGPELAKVCRGKGLEVVQKFLEDVERNELPDKSIAFVSFELFEHLHNPSAFLSKLHQLMRSGDVFIFTTLSGMGLDIQTLWQNSKSVSPPHHLNFFNPRSVKTLLSSIGFTDIAVTTPGRLDIDIMSNNLELLQDRFWKTLLEVASEAEKEELQLLVTDRGWSSHMMTVCRKP